LLLEEFGLNRYLSLVRNKIPLLNARQHFFLLFDDDRWTPQKHVITIFIFLLVLFGIQENIQADRDDPSQPLVTAPFGHASQV
jgi:hypothetical protein